MKYLLFFITVLYSQVMLAQGPMFDICPLKVGTEIPDVAIFNSDSTAQSLKELTTEKPSVIIVYRGAWCGYCTKHLAELNDIKTKVDSLGFQMFGITVDQPTKLSESEKRAKTEIPVYSDPTIEAITALGLDWKVDDALFEKYKTKYKLDLEEWSGQDHHTLPVPAVFVVKEGVIQFQYVNPNHNTRLKAETLLAILQTL